MGRIIIDGGDKRYIKTIVNKTNPVIPSLMPILYILSLFIVNRKLLVLFENQYAQKVKTGIKGNIYLIFGITKIVEHTINKLPIMNTLITHSSVDIKALYAIMKISIMIIQCIINNK